MGFQRGVFEKHISKKTLNVPLLFQMGTSGDQKPTLAGSPHHLHPINPHHPLTIINCDQSTTRD